MTLGPHPFSPTSDVCWGGGSCGSTDATLPLALFAARISVEMAEPIARHALRLKLLAAQASTGKTVGQCSPCEPGRQPWRGGGGGSGDSR